MQRKPVEQRHQHRRHRLDRTVAPALAAGNETDHVVFQQFLHKGRGGVAAREPMLLDKLEEALGKQPGARIIRFIAKIFRQCCVRHQPALLGRKQRGDPRARFLDLQQRLRLAANAWRQRGVSQDVGCGHCHE